MDNYPRNGDFASLKENSKYFTFPDWRGSERLVISRVIGERSGMKSKSSSNKTIHISTDEDLSSIIWTPAPKVDLKIVVNACELLFRNLLGSSDIH